MTERNLYRVLLTLLILSVAGTGLLAVNRTDYATGWDGYYYLVQLKSFTETGEMHSPEFSAVYLPMLFFNWLTGNYLTAYKLSSVFIKLMFVLSVFCLTMTFLKPAKNAGTASLAIASLSAASPSLNYFFTQFPKNLMGFAFLFFFIASSSLLIRSGSKERLRLTAVSVLLFLLTFFTHRFSAVLALLYLVLLGTLHLRRMRFNRMLLLILIPVLAAAVIAHNLSLAPSLYDLERVTGDLSSEPVLVPAAFMEHFGTDKMILPWQAEIILAGIVSLTGLLIILVLRKKVSQEYTSVAILIPMGLFPFLEFSLTGLSYRLFYWTLLAAPVVLIPWICKVKQKGLVTAVIVLCGFSFWSCRSYRPDVQDPPYGIYQEIAEMCTDRLSHSNCQLIIAHSALAEIITFSSGMDALPWAPEERFPRDKVWRITAGLLRDDVSLNLGPETANRYFFRLYADYGLIREDKWEALLNAIGDNPALYNDLSNWRNPMVQRPSYLQKNR